MSYMLWALLAVAAVPFVVEGLFWCFCWCFCKVDDYFRERHMRMILENLNRLDRIASDTDRKAA